MNYYRADGDEREIEKERTRMNTMKSRFLIKTGIRAGLTNSNQFSQLESGHDAIPGELLKIFDNFMSAPFRIVSNYFHFIYFTTTVL